MVHVSKFLKIVIETMLFNLAGNNVINANLVKLVRFFLEIDV